ncbi:AsnC family transcriptional regulator [Advenella kashmirensis W13003]|uniref:AsnC family transcriptional regulator n=1 Tax=Advenella kashmirensis W13003 TaxID=1424334 RepID=V8QVC2_9BURK|nr:Lrp/AsnC family transcriptional regulator [Advenella kashmirensis]ETF03577.1 AsnC family transcriptional regulator [Advenella kashmirensis W13003]
MDSTDQSLISLLRQNARYAVADLAKKLGLSRGTVRNRMLRLEDSGVIVGYTVQLRPDTQIQTIRAWMSIAIEGNMSRQVIASLLGEPCIVALHDTNGRWDLLAELEAASLADLGQALERIRLIRNISNSETSIHLKSYR